MPRRNTKNMNNIQVYGKEIKTTYLRSQVAQKIMKGETKNEIVDWLMLEYDMPFKNAVSAHRQGYVFLYLYGEMTKDEVQKLSMARLEELYEKAEADGTLAGKDYYNTQLKNIDLTNKTAGVYEKNEPLIENNTDLSFNLNVGPENNEKRDESDD